MPLLLIHTTVDDRPWAIQDSIRTLPPPQSSWRGHGRDLLFRLCTPNPDALDKGLADGGHQVRFRASLPGTQPIATPSLLVELMCDAPDPDPAPGGTDSSGCSASKPASSLALFVVALLLRRRRPMRTPAG